MIDCWANPTFRLARKEIDRIRKQLEKIGDISPDLLKEIRHPIGEQLVGSYQTFKRAIAKLDGDFPQNVRKRREIVIEFIMACFVESFGYVPRPYFRPQGHLNLPTPSNSGTQFVEAVLRGAEAEAKVIEDFRKLHQKKSGGVPLKRPGFAGEFRKTMEEVISKWDGEPPRPSEVFPLEGDISIWAGMDPSAQQSDE